MGTSASASGLSKRQGTSGEKYEGMLTAETSVCEASVFLMDLPIPRPWNTRWRCFSCIFQDFLLLFVCATIRHGIVFTRRCLVAVQAAFIRDVLPLFDVLFFRPFLASTSLQNFL